jgi:hypothetical protein
MVNTYFITSYNFIDIFLKDLFRQESIDKVIQCIKYNTLYQLSFIDYLSIVILPVINNFSKEKFLFAYELGIKAASQLERPLWYDYTNDIIYLSSCLSSLKELFDWIDEKKGEDKVFAEFVNRLCKEPVARATKETAIKVAKETAIKERETFALSLLKKNMDDSFILDVVQISQEQLDALKEKLHKANA